VKTKERIVGILEKKSSVTIAELAKILSIGEKRVEKHLSDLKSQGRIQRIGPDKGGHWEVS